jgi:two-component system, chemotaxis family, protein-glutamate methylesterase/glutaminase
LTKLVNGGAREHYGGRVWGPASRHDPSGIAVIALVASAGGLAAVSRVLGDLPETLRASVLVLIHQSPDRASELVALLSRASALPIVAAEHGQRLDPGRAVVVPPGTHLLVTPALEMALIPSGPAPPSRPSADLLLASLAVSAGPRATAVVLSGGGHDGATGATAIHVLGGRVLATDEATSEVFGMPRATIERAGVIDQVVPLNDMAAALGSLTSDPTTARYPGND